MKTRRHTVVLLRGITLAVALSLAPAATLWADQPKGAAPPPPSMAAVQSAYGHLPLSFEANHGQVDAQVKFLARGKGYTLFLTPTESVMVLQQRETKEQGGDKTVSDPLSVTEPAPIKQSVVRMKLEGANPSPAIDGMEQLPGIVNYFIGNDPEKWRTKIPTYAKVQYQQAYPGIDLAYYGNQGKLEYDFIVAPGSDPNQIKLAFDGASEIKVADSGDLLLTTTLGEVHLQKPVVYQLNDDGHKKLVAGSYVVHSESNSETLHASRMTNPVIGVQIAAYDLAKPLIIDPVLSWATYLGGSGFDGPYGLVGGGIAVDVSGNAYVTGLTVSTDFPTNPETVRTTFAGGNYDTFVTKLNSTGSALVYSTYLGGNSDEVSLRIAVDGSGNAYVAGQTSSANFPTTLGAFQTVLAGPNDTFVTKVNPTGTGLVYSTYLGGSDQEFGLGIAVDALPDPNAYVTGLTYSTNFPTTLGAFQMTYGGGIDGFVTKLNPTGSGLVYSTYLGGSSTDSPFGIAVDGGGNAYVTGQTQYTDFPTTLGAFQTTFAGCGDAFVTKLSNTGSALVYSTYLGGIGCDAGYGIAVDSTGNAYVTGIVQQSSQFPANFPTTPGAFQTTFGDNSGDAFVTKLNPTGSALVYSTYLGGNSQEYGFGIAVDVSGNAYVTGFTNSFNFPTTNGAVQTANSGSDAFVTKFNPTGSALLYSTYLGGSHTDVGSGIAVDALPNPNVYVTGYSLSNNFPTTPGAFQTTFAGEDDVFVAKISDLPTNQSPVCSAAQANPASLWTPNQQFVPVVVTGVTDPEGDSVTIIVTTVTQDEPVYSKGGNKTSPDAVIQGGSASLRAERLDTGNGRVYQISFTADDGKGGSCTGAVMVGVPLSLKKGLTAIDDGQIYDSTNSTIP